jgi:hypothetical protein
MLETQGKTFCEVLILSQEIRLNEKDYMQILTWFELAFAKEGKIQTSQDDITMKKISAMATAQQEEQEIFRK